jgi:hypothetical protein
LSLSGEPRLRGTRLFLRSGPIDYVLLALVLVLSTIKTLDTVHLSLISLTFLDAIMRFGKQVIIFILHKNKRCRGSRKEHDIRTYKSILGKTGATVVVVIAAGAATVTVIGHGV